MSQNSQHRFFNEIPDSNSPSQHVNDALQNDLKHKSKETVHSIDAVEKILQAAKQKWPTEFNSMIELCNRMALKSLDIFMPTTPTRTDIRRSKFTQNIEWGRLQRTLVQIQNTKETITKIITPANTPLIMRAVYLTQLDLQTSVQYGPLPLVIS
jgi:midasin (ATPase involved in ribosome maturation)